ncbi:unnamed protein product [Leptosia nina]|uniref:Uncharacterized protein n=1 Tax=Leptosia nina TaxID=320188 RepID=A0AAV1JWX5_9NEOP
MYCVHPMGRSSTHKGLITARARQTDEIIAISNDADRYSVLIIRADMARAPSCDVFSGKFTWRLPGYCKREIRNEVNTRADRRTSSTLSTKLRHPPQAGCIF